jgi:ubiquinone/menaquinone biosynthesis C-methylase UbiE
MKKRDIYSHKSEWESLGKLDPLWAVLSDNDKKFNNWNLDDFLETGRKEVSHVFSKMKELSLGQGRGKMLDFGCGVGRLARHWLDYFDEYNGTDISSSMINKAREINKDVKANFFINNEDLSIFPDNSFDFIYSGIVLQHLPSKEAIKDYTLEFKRVLRSDGALVFQLPSKIPWLFRVQLVRKMYLFLKFFGFSDNFLYKQLGLYPIKMSFIPEGEMASFLKKSGFKVLGINPDTYCGPYVESRTYYCKLGK